MGWLCFDSRESTGGYGRNLVLWPSKINSAFTQMSDDQLKSFLELLRDDPSLQEKLVAAENAEAILEIAKEAGFLISVEDVKGVQISVSDEELESVVGGGNASINNSAGYIGRCCPSARMC